MGGEGKGNGGKVLRNRRVLWETYWNSMGILWEDKEKEAEAR